MSHSRRTIDDQLAEDFGQPTSDGLTDEEGEVMDAIFDAFNAYTELPVQHPDEPGEFRYHIHMLQGLLACRIARRDYPAGWTNAAP